jgi:peptide/nickel transport system ATP-binding protein
MNTLMSVMDNNSLELRDVNYDVKASGGYFNREPIRLLNGINVDIKPGRITALVGESGSGKSTIAKLLSRLITPTDGVVSLNAIAADHTGYSKKLFSRKVQLVFQNPYDSLNPMHTVNYHLERALKLSLNYKNHQIPGRIAELLERVGLTPVNEVAKKLPNALSGGQRQRLSLARALAMNPKFIIADEPTSMLDVSIRLGILNLFKEIVGQGVGVLLITHDLATARYLSDDIMILYCGHVVEYGPTETVIQAPTHPYSQLLLGACISRETDWRSMNKSDVASGEPPRWSPSKKGCTFANRCALVTDQCKTQSPVNRALPNSAYVACWHKG